MFLIDARVPFVIHVKGSYKIFEIDSHTQISIHQLLKRYGRRKKVLNVPVDLSGLQLYLSFRKG
ncbi:MAG: hypothetical protein KDK65_07995, partial [Chlamydiia bacterium]|nr:hypothetical protein [Chlamydiia bacterium]